MRQHVGRRLERRRWRVTGVAAASAVFVVLLAAFATVLGDSSSAGRHELVARFEARTELAGQSVATWLDDQLHRQRSYAARVLGRPGATASPGDAAAAFDFVDVDIVDLAAPAAGPAVSSTVDAGHGILTLSVPFERSGGPAVFRGRYRADETTLPRLLAQSMPIKGRQVHLVDGAGTVVASNTIASGTSLVDVDATLAAAIAGGRSTASLDDAEHQVHVAPVAGTGWRVATAVPQELLFRPIEHGSGVPWLLFAAFAAVGLIALVLLWWITGEHARLAATSRRDDATGLYNRAHAEERLAEVAAAARRHQREWSAVLIDIDRFKSINDQLGHHAGDLAIRAVAGELQRCIRTEDVAARWGGDEFLVLLPDTAAAEAREVAERVRTAVESMAALAPGVQTTLSLGVAGTVDDRPGDVVARADAALYEAKRTGRNRTWVDESSPQLVVELRRAEAHAVHAR